MHSDIAPFVTAEVARGLTAGGLFTLPPAAAPADLPIITEARAGQLAVAYLRTFGFDRASLFRRERGGDIDMHRLQMDPRIFHADTPHEPFPRGGHPAYTRFAGPYYLVHFTSGGERVLLIAVSAYASDVGIDERGLVELPTFAGGEFQPVAVSIDPTTGPMRYVPISPEQAVEYVASRTGARVAETPRLMLRGRPWAPALAQWKLVLEPPVSVRNVRTGAPAAAPELYVGPGLRLTIASAAQPAARAVSYAPPDPELTSAPLPPRRRGTLGRHSGMAVNFDDVTLDQSRD